jgi:manganese oxidase
MRLWRRTALVIVAVGGAAAIITVVVASQSHGTSSPPPADIHLQLGDYFISGDLEVPAGDVVLEAVNVGVQPHNVGIRRGPITTNIAAGKSARLDLGVLSPGTYELYCDIVDHVAQGMVATLVVTPTG